MYRGDRRDSGQAFELRAQHWGSVKALSRLCRSTCIGVYTADRWILNTGPFQRQRSQLLEWAVQKTLTGIVVRQRAKILGQLEARGSFDHEKRLPCVQQGEH
jgi:hypothetical protein